MAAVCWKVIFGFMSQPTTYTVTKPPVWVTTEHPARSRRRTS